MANNETRVLKTNTFEDWRQKDNEISFELGDVDQLDARILDKNYTFTAAAGDAQFTSSGADALRFEQAPEHVTDMLHVVIFTGLSTVPSNFVAGATCTQSGGFSGKILWINKNKAAFSTVSGTFNAGQNLVQGAQNIAHANLHSTLSESVKVGYARVKVEGTEISQSQIQAGWHVPNYSLKVVTTGSPTIPTEWVEGVTLTQSGGFSGTLLYADSTVVRFKSHSGSFSTTQQLVLSTDNTKKLTAGQLASSVVQDTTFENIVELHTLSSASDVVLVIANSAVHAINEVQDDVGDITTLGTTDKSDVVTAINEIETAVRGSAANYTLGTTATDLVAAVNELETAARAANGNYTLTTSVPDFRSAINELDAELGTITAGAMGTSASTVSTAIKEHEDQIGDENINSIAGGNNTLAGALVQIHTEIGDVSASNMGTTASNITAAIAEHETQINQNDTDIGAMSFTGSGTTIGGTSTSITTALNALDAEIGDTDSYNGGTYGASTIAGTLDLLQAGMISNDTDIAARLIKVSGSSQTLETNVSFTGNKTFTVASGSTMDLSGGTLLLPGNASGINTFSVSYLEVDGNQTSTGMGMRINRGHIGGAATPHPSIQWREGSVSSKPERAWQIVGLDDGGTNSTEADIVTFYNAKDLFANNTENGANIIWQSSTQNFDIVLDNSTFALTGDVTGSVTQTAKGNVSIATTIAANSVALGTDTTGNYVSTIAGTANEITVTGSGSETAGVTIALPDDVTIGNNLVVTDYTRTAGLRVGTSGTDPGDGVLAVASHATVGGNLTVTGNFTVNGTTTTLSTTNLEVEDTLILAGSDLGNTEPNSGGFGIETKPFAGVHSNAAAGVTGAHSLVYNFAEDRWEADGALILSTATQSSPSIKHTGGSSVDLETDDTLTFTTGASGQGLSVAVSKSSNALTALITNTDKGSAQNIFKNVAADSGGTAAAGSNTDTLTISGGNALESVRNGETITINHSDTSSQASVNNSADAVIQDITLDTYGHITAIGSANLDGRYKPSSEFTSANTASKPVIRDGNGNFSAGTITATLSGAATSAGTATTATNANKVNINSASGNSSYRLVFTETNDTVNANKFIYQDTGANLYYNPSTNVLTSGTFSGSHSGNGSGLSSLNASNISSGTISDARLPDNISSNISGDCSGTSTYVSISYNDNSNASYQLLWGSGSRVYGTAGVTLNANNNHVTATQFNGTLNGNGANVTSINGSNISSGTIAAARVATLNQNTTGSAASATNATNADNWDIDFTNLTNNYYPTFVLGTSNENKAGYADTNFYYNAGTNTLYAGTFSGNASSATQVYVTGTSSNASYRMVFGEANDGYNANESLYKDTAANFYYNPSTNTLTTGYFSGNGASLTSLNAGNCSSGTLAIARGGTGNTVGQATYVDITHSDGNASYPLVWRSAADTAAYTDEVYVNASSNIVYATDFIASSDERQKDIIEPITGALDKVCAIDGFIYKWNDKAASLDKETRQVGISAQAVQVVLPEAVNEKDDGYLGVAYDKLVPLLIESIKELKAEVEELKSINR